MRGSGTPVTGWCRPRRQRHPSPLQSAGGLLMPRPPSCVFIVLTQARSFMTASRPARSQPKEVDGVAVPSPSASVVLIAPTQPGTTTPDGYNYRSLLLQRHAKSSTFVSAHVFPGGNLDAADKDSAWKSLYSSSTVVDSSDLALRLCAVRETFEESGVLLVEDDEDSSGKKGHEVWASVPEQERKQWRDKVHSQASSFVDLFKFLSEKSGKPCRPALSQLQYRGNWVTPRINSRRFDTHFYVAVLPPAASTSSSTTPGGEAQSSSTPSSFSESLVSHDGKETVKAEWVTPPQAIRRTLGSSNADEPPIILFPPQFYLLAELMPYKSYQSLLLPPTSSSHAPIIRPRQVKPFEPEIAFIPSPTPEDPGRVRPATVLPGDPLNSSTEDLLRSLGIDVQSKAEKELFKLRRHRTYVVLPPKKKGEKPPPGMRVVGVHRRGMKDLLGSGWEDMKHGEIVHDSGRSLDNVDKAKL
ncbi:hypothetical protein T439DRAFT_381637 [Meredithblackwellia eburnea MCA 4105]